MSELNFVPGTIFHMDNLDALRGMNSNTIDLIATDPPYNTGRNREGKGGKYPDQWLWDDAVHPEWMAQIRDDNRALVEVIEAAMHAQDKDFGAFLCFMGQRLIEMRRVLKPTGSIYLQCDTTASHYLKASMDAVFGKDNFRNEIAWKRHESHNNANRYGNVVDKILYYGSDARTWNQQYGPYSEEQLSRYKQDDNGRYYRRDDMTAPSPNDSRRFEWRGTTPGPNRSWAHGLEELERLWDAGLIAVKRDGTPALDGHIKYLDEAKGQPLLNIWTDIKRVSNTSKERTGYPDQKPVALYERIILASSNVGDLVFDPFCGCGTTIMAARENGRRWVGVDRSDNARYMILCRLAGLKKDEVEDMREKTKHTDPGYVDRMLAKHEAVFTREPPARTDDGDESTPVLQQVYSKRERSVFTRAQMRHLLFNRFGSHCWGCDFEAPAGDRGIQYLELDHVNPKSGGGSDHLDNRALLCGPCNGPGGKGEDLSLVGLRKKVLGVKAARTHRIDLKEASEWCRQRLQQEKRKGGQ